MADGFEVHHLTPLLRKNEIPSEVLRILTEDYGYSRDDPYNLVELPNSELDAKAQNSARHRSGHSPYTSWARQIEVEIGTKFGVNDAEGKPTNIPIDASIRSAMKADLDKFQYASAWMLLGDVDPNTGEASPPKHALYLRTWNVDQSKYTSSADFYQKFYKTRNLDFLEGLDVFKNACPSSEFLVPEAA